MPLFGKKESKEKKPGSYPKAAPANQPGASAYPTAPPAGSQQPQAPPPYYAQGVPPQQPLYPGQAHPHPPPGYNQPPQQYHPAPGQAYPGQYTPPMQQPQTTVVVKDGFDAGARFDVSGPSLPPPPPGCMPTASQVAAAQGHNVVVTQRKGDFVSGGSDGGMVIW